MAIWNKKGTKKNEATVSKINSLLTAASTARRKFDLDWYKFEQYIKGNHYVYWHRTTQRIIILPRKLGQERVTINQTYKAYRAVKGFITRFRPKWNILPTGAAENLDRIKKTNLFADYLYDHLHMREKVKDVVGYALKRSPGIFEYGFDPDADEGEGELYVNVIDPFDFYIDPTATGLEDARYCIKAVRRTLAEIKQNEHYKNTDKIVTDKKLAISTAKSSLIRTNYLHTENQGDAELQTVILKEVYFREKDGIKIVTVAGDTLLREEKSELKDFPFVPYFGDKTPGEFYGEPWAKPVIHVNRVINRLESQTLQYLSLMLKGKWIADKGHGVPGITDETGEIISVVRGHKFEQMRLQNLPSSIPDTLERHNRYLEDIGGQHDASLGRVPPGAKAGVAIEALQQGDANNLIDYTSNLEITLEELIEKLLALAADNYKSSKLVEIVGGEGKPTAFKVTGQSAPVQPEGVLVIGPANRVRVTIESWLAYTKSAQQEVLKELYSLEAISQRSLLQGIRIGGIEQIIEETTREKAEEAEREKEIAGRGGEGEGEGGEVTAPSVRPDEVELAEDENRRMAKGERISPTQNISPAHTDVHVKLTEQPEFKNAPEEVRNIFDQHINGEIAGLRG